MSFVEKLKSVAFGIARNALDNRTGLIDVALNAAKLVHSTKDEQKAFAKSALDKVEVEVNAEIRKGVQNTIDEFEKAKGVDIPDELETDLVEIVADAYNAAFENVIENRLLAVIG